MISWIQTTFQHHFRSIFAVLLALIIVSFVFTIGASPGLGRADREKIARPFFDLNLGTVEGSQKLMGDASLSAYLNLGYGGLDNEQLQQYALQRYAALHIANQLHLPPPNASELADYLKKLRVFAGQNGEFDPQAYARFRDSLKTNPRLREGDITRVMGDDYRVDRVQKMFAGPGYVLPADVKKQLERADTSWTLKVATLDTESFKPAISPSEEQLKKYFEDNSARYTIPPRFKGSYIEIPSTQFLAQVSVTDADVKAYYDANPSRFPNPAKKDAKDTSKKDAASEAAAAAADFAAVKATVESQLKLERARQAANKVAADLTVALFEKKTTAATLGAILAERHLSLKPLTPFTRNEGPVELGGSMEASREAFKLAADRFYSDAIGTPTGAAILFYEETIPARTPTLAEVRARVSNDYVEDEKRKRLVDLGRTLKSALETKLKAGEAFVKAVESSASANSVKMEAKEIAPFTLRTPPQDLDYSIYGTLEQIEKGQVSNLTLAGPKGFIVYAADKKAPDLNSTNPQYATMMTQLARSTGGATGMGMLSEMVEKELKKGVPAAAN